MIFLRRCHSRVMNGTATSPPINVPNAARRVIFLSIPERPNVVGRNFQPHCFLFYATCEKIASKFSIKIRKNRKFLQPVSQKGFTTIYFGVSREKSAIFAFFVKRRGFILCNAQKVCQPMATKTISGYGGALSLHGKGDYGIGKVGSAAMISTLQNWKETGRRKQDQGKLSIGRSE